MSQVALCDRWGRITRARSSDIPRCRSTRTARRRSDAARRHRQLHQQPPAVPRTPPRRRAGRLRLREPAAGGDRRPARRAARLDVGLVPSIELARIPGLDGRCPASPSPRRTRCAASSWSRRSRSARSPPWRSTRTAAPRRRSCASSSRSATASRPAFRPARADLDEMLAAADAALIIGDPALTVPRETLRRPRPRRRVAGDDRPAVRLRGLGGARGSRRPPSSSRRFAASLETGLAELDAIVAETAAETGLAPAVLARLLHPQPPLPHGPRRTGRPRRVPPPRGKPRPHLGPRGAALRARRLLGSSAERHSPSPCVEGAGSLLQELFEHEPIPAAGSGTSWCFSSPPRWRRPWCAQPTEQGGARLPRNRRSSARSSTFGPASCG